MRWTNISERGALECIWGKKVTRSGGENQELTGKALRNRLRTLGKDEYAANGARLIPLVVKNALEVGEVALPVVQLSCLGVVKDKCRCQDSIFFVLL